MRGVAKVKIMMAAFAGQKVGARHDGLRLQGFERCVHRQFRGDDGGHRRFQIHGDNGHNFPVNRSYVKSPLIFPVDFSRNAQEKTDGIPAAPGRLYLSGVNKPAAAFQKQARL